MESSNHWAAFRKSLPRNVTPKLSWCNGWRSQEQAAALALIPSVEAERLGVCPLADLPLGRHQKRFFRESRWTNGPRFSWFSWVQACTSCEHWVEEHYNDAKTNAKTCQVQLRILTPLWPLRVTRGLSLPPKKTLQLRDWPQRSVWRSSSRILRRSAGSGRSRISWSSRKPHRRWNIWNHVEPQRSTQGC